jgi:predicted branched-subunit amino acid permease
MTEVARAHLQLGIRTALVTPAWILGFSFLGVGSLAREAGHPLGAALLSTIIVWAAPAQLILYGSLAGGGLLLAAAIAVALSAIRLLPMTLSVLPYLRRPGQTILTQALMAHFIAATTWVESMRTLPDLTEEGRVPYFLGFSLTCFAFTVAATGTGFLLLDALPLPLAAGLLCLTPIYFTISLTASARTATDWVAIALGLLLAPLAQHLVGRDFDLLVAGIVGGTIAYVVGRRGRIIAA